MCRNDDDASDRTSEREKLSKSVLCDVFRAESLDRVDIQRRLVVHPSTTSTILFAKLLTRFQFLELIFKQFTFEKRNSKLT